MHKLRKIVLSTVLLFMTIQQAMASDATAFITKWQTTTNGETVTIPTTGTGYNYDIDCDNDDTYEQTGLTGEGTCTFASAGEHIVQIKGAFPRIYINANATMKDKLLEVMQWGAMEWDSMFRAFKGAANLQVTATDTPNVSAVTNMQEMFHSASTVNFPMNDWNVSSVTNMSYAFYGATDFNQTLNSWDVSKVSRVTIKNLAIKVTLNQVGQTGIEVENSDNHKVSKLNIAVPNAQTQVLADGSIGASVELENGNRLESNITKEGKSSYTVRSGAKQTQVVSDIEGAEVTISENGDIELSTTMEHNDYRYEMVITTTADGETTTRFIVTEIASGKVVENDPLLNDAYTFGEGSLINILEIDGVIYIKAQAPLSRKLVIE